MTEEILTRVESAGVDVLVITIDVPVPGRRLRDLRNELELPLRPSGRVIAGCIRSPRWLFRRLWAGRISFPHFERAIGWQRLPFHQMMALQTGGPLDWEWCKRLRARWPRKLVVKGVLCSRDAATAKEIGIDGLIVSNHGGRQFDAAPASLKCLPGVKAASGRCAVMLDSGLRSGTDIARGLAIGADFTWIGRPFLYALAALGENGPRELIDLLVSETRNALSLAGCAKPGALRARNGEDVELISPSTGEAPPDEAAKDEIGTLPA